jgi:hypothetical protein
MKPISTSGFMRRSMYVSKIRSTIVQSYFGRPFSSSVYALVDPHFSAGVPSPVVSRLCVRRKTGAGLSAASSDSSFRPSFM